ncbi:MAG: lipoprotein-releasing system ATP-binding protein LolD [Candidatus Zixiibacteriota bacterium]|nr:MAG: lipoprotein-releasing system ATP-binding protein LolD [candidate division Zixibacteria bacterium]
MNDNDWILEAEDIHREFRTPEATLKVLQGISLNLSKGETVAVTGASGIGKSTLLHLLGGLDKPTSGEVRIGGTLLGDQSEEKLACFRNRNVGFVFQFHYLMEDFSALENVMIPMLISGRKRRDAENRGELLLKQVGLSNRKSHRPDQLSGGEQQRVAVARALANEPKIVLADEPSGNLDTKTGHQLHDLLFTLNKDSAMSFLIATHNQELAQGCNRQLEIVDGKIREHE